MSKLFDAVNALEEADANINYMLVCMMLPKQNQRDECAKVKTTNAFVG